MSYPDDFWTGIVRRSVGQKFGVNKSKKEKILTAGKSFKAFSLCCKVSYATSTL